MNFEYLPIGSIVVLNSSETYKFMIVGYLPTNESGEQRDYSAIRYPMGFYDNRLFFFFNHADISDILHTGYIDEDFEMMMSFLRVAKEKTTENTNHS
jgi:Uncharacterized protein conserved in bacteria